MILAEKITNLRKRNGWSQEDLAMKLDVSRQSVSKWESAASVPDLDKIIKLAQIFGVSTDYLLKDSMNEDNFSPVEDTYESESLISISLETANEYMDIKEKISKKIALAVMMFILSPVPLILMAGLSEYKTGFLTENMAAGFGVAILLILVCVGVAICILNGMKTSRFEYIEKEIFKTQYGVESVAEKKREDFLPVYNIGIVIGVALCILSPIPLMVSAAFDAGDLTCIYCLVALLVMISVGVFLFVWVGTIKGSYDALLQEGDYTVEKKSDEKRTAAFSGIYWCVVTAIYLAWSFITHRWDFTWIVWPVAGVLFAAIKATVALIARRNGK